MKKKSGPEARPQQSRNHLDDARGGECQRPAECISCSGTHVWWVGFHERTASVLEDGKVVHLTGLICRRARCANCRDTWIVRALKLFPGRHFQLEIVAEALAQYLFQAKATLLAVAAWAKCAERTLRRWIEWIGAVSTPRELVARLTELAGRPVRLKSLPVAGESRKGATEARRSLLRAAAWNLTLLEGLGAALELEPPGLRSVLLRIIGDRARTTTYARPAIPEFAESLNWCGSATLAM